MTTIELVLKNLTTGTMFDATPYLLDDETDLLVSIERERTRFERVVNDMNARLSNLTGELWVFLSSMNRTDKVSCSLLVDGAERFWGRVDTSTSRLSTDSKYVTLSAFSAERHLFDLAANFPVRPATPADIEPPNPWVNKNTLDYVVRKGLYANGAETTGGLIIGVDLGPFATRPINYTGSLYSGETRGRWLDIDPRMRWKDMLLKIALYYNAEFYIEGRILKMQPRGKVLRSGISLDASLKDDTEPEVTLMEEPVDYAHAFVTFTLPAPTYLGKEWKEYKDWDTLKQITVHASKVWYRVLYYRDDEDGNKVLAYSGEVLEVELGPVDSTHGWFVHLALPAGPIGTTGRRVFRMTVGGESDGYLRLPVPLMVEGNEDGTPYLDNWGYWLLHQNADQLRMPALPKNFVTAYVRYNQQTGAWDEPIFDFEQSSVAGTVVDLRPTIAFASPTNEREIIPEDPRDVWRLFGEEMDYQKFQEQYLDMFELRRGVRFAVKGLDFQLGDEVHSYKHPVLSAYGNMVVKSVEMNPRKEECMLTCWAREAA